ncbi:hypothetical protein FSC02_07955 [Acinetobacter indicus]|uniref:hypothetical protein n=1 Tax=Acinetobacter indicus TaxID=756892 RepID=UPI0013B075A4|nr:hypothetical protein [Acinetobacter indicus]QIC79057.1 hypothetical protein FSC02_07955 [Acinetobacter indicus]
MPLPTAAEMQDRSKTNAQMRELLSAIVENIPIEIDEAIKSKIINQRENYNRVKPYLSTALDFKDLTFYECQVFDFIKSLSLNGDNDKNFSLILDYSNNAIANLKLTDGSLQISLIPDTLGTSVIKDDGIFKTIQFSHYTPSDGKLTTGEIVVDYSPKDYASFAYNLSEAHPNLRFKALPRLEQIRNNGVLNLNATAKGNLVTNSVYMSFQVDEPFILGSVSVDIIQVPSDQPSWVECTIYPLDNGYGTAPRISSTDQVPIEKLGSLRMPLERKVMQPGKYTIGFKTNAPECLAVANGDFWRAYDTHDRPMSLTAPNLKYPYSDKYGFFPAFSLYKHESVLQPKLGANWHLEYRPEFNFMGGNDDALFYIHMSGLSGSRDIWFGMSTDGGKTINKIGLNANESTDLPLIVDAMHGVSRFVGDTFEMYIARGAGKITKVVINAGQAPVITDITPYSNVSTNDLHSYAPLVIFKGFLWWGEYGNPEAPKIHKMDLDTGTWYVSIEKPLSGPSGARHVHFLYPSPYDKNVLWSNWGDASNGGGQGVNKLTITSAKAGAGLDTWVQFSTGRHDDVNTTLPYPTAIMEIYEPANGKLGGNEVVMIGAGDQPPVHLTMMRTKAELAGKALFKPLNFKRESAPNTETVHWLAMDEDKTIYYMTVESNPHMSIYASPYPYTETFQISKYWQQALSGKMYYSNGFLHTKNHRFPKVKFVNALDAVDDQISKVPYIASANESNIITQFNKLIENLQGAGILQTVYEQGNDKNQSVYIDENGKWENWG